MIKVFSGTTVLFLFFLVNVSTSQPAGTEKHDEHRLYVFEESFKVVWKDIVEFFETNEVKVRTTEKDRVAQIFGDTDKVKVFAHSPQDNPNQTTVLITTKSSDELRNDLLKHLQLEHTLETDVNAVIKDCYKEVTGREAKNINRVTRDTDSKLEECVNGRIELPNYRISMQYAGSKNGLIPTIGSVVSEDD